MSFQPNSNRTIHHQLHRQPEAGARSGEATTQLKWNHPPDREMYFKVQGFLKTTTEYIDAVMDAGVPPAPTMIAWCKKTDAVLAYVTGGPDRGLVAILKGGDITLDRNFKAMCLPFVSREQAEHFFTHHGEEIQGRPQ